MGTTSWSRVWMMMGLLMVVWLSSGSDATTCEEVINPEMQTCLSYVRGQGGSSATACCGAVTSIDPLDKNAVCTCLKDELLWAPAKATLGIRISFTCGSSYSAYVLTRVFTTLPSSIDCSRIVGTAAE